MEYEQQNPFGKAAGWLVLLLWLPVLSWGQSIERQVFGAGGGSGSSGAYTYAFTWGEPISGTDQSNLPALTMGFHQPLLEALLAPGLDGLTGRYAGGQTWLQWQAHLPTELARMEVQRQAVNGLFVSLGEVAPVAGQLHYQFLDRHPIAVKEQLYYRVFWLDQSGQQGYTPMISLELPGSDPVLRLFPQPVQGMLTLELVGLEGRVEFRLLDVLGQTVLRQSEAVFSGWQGQWDMSRLAAGGYVLEVQGGGFFCRRQLWRQ